jgi:hypothetical protein
MRRVPFRAPVAVALALALAAVVATAAQTRHNHYKWRDAKGNLHYSDSLPSDAALHGYDVVNADGIVVQHVDRAQTPEERAAAQAALKRSRAAEQQAANAARTDRQLLIAYPGESDLEHAQKQQIDLLDQGIKAARIDLQNQESSLSDLLDRAAEFDHRNQPVPAELAAEISEMRQRSRSQRDTVERKIAERAETERRFAGDLAHYRKLKAADLRQQE